MGKQRQIDAYETKTNLPAFLREVRAGARFTITQRGEPIAELVPYGTTSQRAKIEAVARMQAFMTRHPPIQEVDLKALMEQGRD